MVIHHNNSKKQDVNANSQPNNIQQEVSYAVWKDNISTKKQMKQIWNIERR